MCDECEQKQNEITTPFKNYTLDELEQAHQIGNKSSYTGDETAWLYNLYNRVFRTNKQPGCGKCFVNIRKGLTKRYEVEKYG